MKKHQNKVQNQCVLITGATSGIGEATAKAFAEKGYSLVLTGRRTDRLKKVSAVCLKLGASKAIVAKCDVKNLNEIKKVQLELKKQKLSVSVLVNNAGLAKGTGVFQESQMADADEMIDTNVKGLLQITREFLPEVIANKGQIVNLGSVAGRLVYEGGTVYCATKFAVRAISDALRLDLKGTGVRVTNIEPGMVSTEFSLVRLGNQQKADAVYSDMMPLSANDIAQSILWCVTQPPHVNISELVIYPTDQASVGHVVRGERSVKNLKKNK
jgi:NADP-dependent 3-hydroxy acid dehydrogenase YdfG